MDVIRGYRTKLDAVFDVNQPVQFRFETRGPSEYDASAFCLTAEDKLYTDDYMIFYNQPRDADGSVVYAHQGPGEDVFTVTLSAIPAYIQKVAFALTVDGDTKLSQMQSHSIRLSQPGREDVVCDVSPSDFAEETALVCVELYEKNGWRVNFVCRGFNGGLGDLLRFYGGTEAAEEDAPAEPAAQPAPPPPVPPVQPTAAPPAAPAPASSAGELVFVPASMVDAVKGSCPSFWVYDQDCRPYDAGKTYPVRAFEDVPKALAFAGETAGPGPAAVRFYVSGMVGNPNTVLAILERYPNIRFQFVLFRPAGNGVFDRMPALPNAAVTYAA